MILNTLKDVAFKTKRGFTIVEMIIAVAIGLIVLASVLQLWMTFTQIFVNMRELADMERTLSFVGEGITKDARGVGVGISQNARCVPGVGFRPGVRANVSPWSVGNPGIQAFETIGVVGFNNSSPSPPAQVNQSDQIVYYVADPFMTFPLRCGADDPKNECGLNPPARNLWTFVIEGGGDLGLCSNNIATCFSPTQFCPGDFVTVYDFNRASLLAIQSCINVPNRNNPGIQDAMLRASVNYHPQNNINLHRMDEGDPLDYPEYEGSGSNPRTYIAKTTIKNYRVVSTPEIFPSGERNRELEVRHLSTIEDIKTPIRLMNAIYTFQILYGLEDPLRWPATVQDVADGIGPTHRVAMPFERNLSTTQAIALEQSLRVRAMLFYITSSATMVKPLSSFSPARIVQIPGSVWGLGDFAIPNTVDGIERRMYQSLVDFTNVVQGSNWGGPAARYVMKHNRGCI